MAARAYREAAGYLDKSPAGKAEAKALERKWTDEEKKKIRENIDREQKKKFEELIQPLSGKSRAERRYGAGK